MSNNTEIGYVRSKKPRSLTIEMPEAPEHNRWQNLTVGFNLTPGFAELEPGTKVEMEYRSDNVRMGAWFIKRVL